MNTIKSTLLALSILVFVSCSGEKVNSDDIPQAVKEQFSKDYPGKDKVEWEKEGKNFEAEFEENGMEKSVVYDKDGKVVLTETEIKRSGLPAAANRHISEHYKGYSLEEAEKQESSEGVRYEVELKMNDEEVELLFDSEGNFIGEENEEESDEEEEKKE